MRPVVQLEPTGCGIASAASIAGLSYWKAKSIANRMGIHAEDRRLWSGTSHVRRLLRRLGFGTVSRAPFRSWSTLPDLALLSIKWHLEKGRPYWHWVVFVRRDAGRAYVLDSKRGLRKNRRTDFGRMKPKWFIAVGAGQLSRP